MNEKHERKPLPTKYLKLIAKYPKIRIRFNYQSNNEFIYEKIVNVKNTFQIVEKTLSNCNKYRIPIEIHTIALHYNYNELFDIAKYLFQKFN